MDTKKLPWYLLAGTCLISAIIIGDLSHKSITTEIDDTIPGKEIVRYRLLAPELGKGYGVASLLGLGLSIYKINESENESEELGNKNQKKNNSKGDPESKVEKLVKTEPISTFRNTVAEQVIEKPISESVVTPLPMTVVPETKIEEPNVTVDFQAFENPEFKDLRSESAKKFSFLKDATQFHMLARTLLFANTVPSVRVMGGSGSGKSSLTREILNECLKKVPFKINLHDPQDGSPEDRWGIPKASKTLSQTGQAIHRLRDLVEKKLDPKILTIDCADELDGLMRSDESVKSAYLTVSTQVRHLKNQGLIVIGQSPTVGNKGLQWGDMDSIGCIYLMDSSIQAITHSPKLKTWFRQLSDEYKMLLAESTRTNEIEKQRLIAEAKKQGVMDEWELSQIEAKNFFRFALVVLPGTTPFWMEVPVFNHGIPEYTKLLKKIADSKAQKETDNKNI